MLRFPNRDLGPDHPERRALAALSDRLGVAADRIALGGSITEYVGAGRALAPRVRDAARQQALTDRFLAPELAALERLLLVLRRELDPALRCARPTRDGKPYPLGQCWQIAEAMLARLDGPAPTDAAAGAEGWAALQAFRAAGGLMRRAWGDLRGQYFQNALIVGALYVDVANDTVVATKPPVEILPFAAADFRPVADYGHYMRIASKYWGRRFLPNHLLPDLAPYAPLLEILPDGRIAIGPLDNYMLALTLVGGFAPSAAILAASPLQAGVFTALKAVLEGGPTPVAATPGEGRDLAIRACRAGRDAGCADAGTVLNRAIVAALDANRTLAGLALRQSA